MKERKKEKWNTVISYSNETNTWKKDKDRHVCWPNTPWKAYALLIGNATIPQPPWVGRGKINYYFVKIGSPLLQTFGSPRRIGNDKDVEVNDESDDE